MSNLILVCSNHHTLIDSDPKKYNVEKLAKMKEIHENKSLQELDISQNALSEIMVSLHEESSLKMIQRYFDVYKKTSSPKTREFARECLRYLLNNMSSTEFPKLETKNFLDELFELIAKEIYQNEKFNDAIIDLTLIAFDQMPKIVDRRTINKYKTEVPQKLKKRSRRNY